MPLTFTKEDIEIIQSRQQTIIEQRQELIGEVMHNKDKYDQETYDQTILEAEQEIKEARIIILALDTLYRDQKRKQQHKKRKRSKIQEVCIHAFIKPAGPGLVRCVNCQLVVSNKESEEYYK